MNCVLIFSLDILQNLKEEASKYFSWSGEEFVFFNAECVIMNFNFINESLIKN